MIKFKSCNIKSDINMRLIMHAATCEYSKANEKLLSSRCYKVSDFEFTLAVLYISWQTSEASKTRAASSFKISNPRPMASIITTVRKQLYFPRVSILTLGGKLVFLKNVTNFVNNVKIFPRDDRANALAAGDDQRGAQKHIGCNASEPATYLSTFLFN